MGQLRSPGYFRRTGSGQELDRNHGHCARGSGAWAERWGENHDRAIGGAGEAHALEWFDRALSNESGVEGESRKDIAVAVGPGRRGIDGQTTRRSGTAATASRVPAANAPTIEAPAKREALRYRPRQLPRVLERQPGWRRRPDARFQRLSPTRAVLSLRCDPLTGQRKQRSQRSAGRRLVWQRPHLGRDALLSASRPPSGATRT